MMKLRGNKVFKEGHDAYFKIHKIFKDNSVEIIIVTAVMKISVNIDVKMKIRKTERIGNNIMRLKLFLLCNEKNKGPLYLFSCPEILNYLYIKCLCL